MKNRDSNFIYRSCIDKIKGDCPLMYRNEYGVPCCTIDGIVQVQFYGCTPHEILVRMSKKEE